MLQIHFTYAEVRDRGYGLEVNGKDLSDIISKALGTRAEGVSWNDPRKDKLKEFYSNSCDVTVIINPHSKGVQIETEDERYDSLEELEEDINERVGEKATEAES